MRSSASGGRSLSSAIAWTWRKIEQDLLDDPAVLRIHVDVLLTLDDVGPRTSRR